jgi:endonuclease/exonuclease/phosphatase family metal-dependent hydrolase
MISPLDGVGRRLFFRTFALVVVTILVVETCAVRPSATVATFNIENFPKSGTQIEGAFETIDELGAGLVAVQEITEPATLRRAARRHLGPSWRFLGPDDEPYHRLGLLVDTARFEVESLDIHDETVVHGGGRPVVEGELTAPSGRALEVFVVHFKAGSEGLPIRREQYAALQRVLRDHEDPARTTVVLGDFNSTALADYRLLKSMAETTSMRWVTRHTECTGYWEPGETCESFALDHVLAEGLAARALSRGPCESIGCEPGGTCPVFHRRVSDHCPVTVRLVPK